MSKASYEGSCLCGKTRYRAQGPATNLCYCHCRSCRGAAGASMVAWATFEKAKFEVTAGDLMLYRSSSHVLRGFCPRCGTALTYVHDRRPDAIDVTLATIPDPGDLHPRAHIWVSHKLPWVTLGDGLPQFPEWAPSPKPEAT